MTPQDSEKFAHSRTPSDQWPSSAQADVQGSGQHNASPITKHRLRLIPESDLSALSASQLQSVSALAHTNTFTKNTPNFFGLQHTHTSLPQVLPDQAQPSPRGNLEHYKDTDKVSSPGVLAEHYKDTDKVSSSVEQADFNTIVTPSSPEALPAPKPTTSIFTTARRAIAHPAFKLTISLLIGIGLLLFIIHLIDIPKVVSLIRQQLITPRGLFCALMASIFFMLAFFFRAGRWKLFLNPIGKIGLLKVIQLFMAGVFLNFLVPIRIGEVAKALILKRTKHIPIGESLSTITIDKVFDLLPALFIVILVFLLHLELDSRFWFVLILANGVLLGMIFFVVLAAWKKQFAYTLLQWITGLLPQGIGTKIEGFAMNFVDAVLKSARDPKIFLLATLLTVIAVCCDGLYNFFSFWAIGYPISFGQAVFGYMIFNIFYILPTPPGQVGSNEVVGLIIFHTLLHIPADVVLAMLGLFHLWSGLLMCITGAVNLSALGMTFSSTMKMSTAGEPQTEHLISSTKKSLSLH